jgi:hypothetical protein
MPTECDVQDAQAVQTVQEDGDGAQSNGQKSGIRCMQPI